MFSIRQKREIADAVQRILRDTNHPELPQGEIEFTLHVHGAEDWSYAMIRNNAAVIQPGMNPMDTRALACQTLVRNATSPANPLRSQAGWIESLL